MFSILIPVYNSEAFLYECLESIAQQKNSLEPVEVLVLNDASPLSKTGQREFDCKKIVKNAKKELKLKIQYLENEENQGLVEVRRKLVYEAKGEYVLMLDSDDCLPSDALSSYEAVLKDHSPDIIAGQNYSFTQKDNFNEKKSFTVAVGALSGQEIFLDCYEKKLISKTVWGKLYRRELLLESYNYIPFTYCNLAEDYLLNFFVLLFAKSYVGIDRFVYCYRTNSGMTSKKKIESLEQWQQICSTASVFTIINFSLQNKEISANLPCMNESTVKALNTDMVMYINNNLDQMCELVPQIKNEALELLKDFWGPELVEKVIAKKEKDSKKE